MPADLTALPAWQSVVLEDDTSFQCKGLEAQFTDTDPEGDLTQGVIVPQFRAINYAEGETVWYRSAVGPTAVAMQRCW